MTAQVNILAIPHRYRGPPNSGNGGYVCGVLARHIQEPTEVTLRAPAPLEAPLEAALRDDGSWELMDGPTVVAVARPAPVELSHLEEASLEEAREAEKNPVIKPKEHLLPMCFVCGPDRPAGDGLRIMAGPLRRRGRHGRVVQAASWTPSRNLSADDGLVAAEFVWAALDCPSGYAATYDPDRDGFDKSPVLLGRLAACISHRPRAGEGCVVTPPAAGAPLVPPQAACACPRASSRRTGATARSFKNTQAASVEQIPIERSLVRHVTRHRLGITSHAARLRAARTGTAEGPG